MPLGCLALHLTRLHIQRGIQRQSAITAVFETVALQSAWRQREHRIQTIQRLNGGFLVYAKHSRMLWRSHVQADHVGSIVFKIRIVARHVAFQAMGTDIGLSQNALHRVLADAEATRQLTARPMGGTVVRAILERGQYPSLQLGCSYRRLLARMPLFYQPCDTMRAKSLLPTRDSRSRGTQHLLDLPVRDALAQQQHHARSHHITCRKSPRLRHLLQFLSLFLAHNNRSSPEWHVYEALNPR